MEDRIEKQGVRNRDSKPTVAVKPESKVKKYFGWTKVDGKPVGIGGPSKIIKDGKEVEIPEATEAQYKKLNISK